MSNGVLGLAGFAAGAAFGLVVWWLMWGPLASLVGFPAPTFFKPITLLVVPIVLGVAGSQAARGR